MLRRFSILAAAMLALAACQSSAPNQGTPPPAPQAAPAAPASMADLRRPSLSVAQAVQIFDNVCVRQAPTFSNTPAAAAENGLTRRGARGSYTHPTGNVRVILDGPTCFMAFSSDEDQQDLDRALTALGSPSMPVDYAPLVMPPLLGPEFGTVMHTVSVTAR